MVIVTENENINIKWLCLGGGTTALLFAAISSFIFLLEFAVSASIINWFIRKPYLWIGRNISQLEVEG